MENAILQQAVDRQLPWCRLAVNREIAVVVFT
jgi:hypothetical protein